MSAGIEVYLGVSPQPKARGHSLCQRPSGETGLTTLEHLSSQIGDAVHSYDNGCALALRVLVKFVFYGPRHDLVADRPLFVDRGHPVKAPVHSRLGISEEQVDIGVLLNVLQVLPPRALPIGQRLVVEDHRAAFVADVRFPLAWDRSQNAG